MSNILSFESVSNNIFQFCKHLRVRTQAKCLLVTVLEEEEEMTQRQILLINAVEVRAKYHTDTHTQHLPQTEQLILGKGVGEIKENCRVKSNARHGETNRSVPGS